MLSRQELAALAASMPQVTEDIHRGNVTWHIGKKGFAWERPFSKADLKRFGDETPPAGPIAAVSVADLHEKAALLAEGLPGVFSIKHFDGYPAVLLQLSVVHKRVAKRLMEEAWLAHAPSALAETYLAGRRR